VTQEAKVIGVDTDISNTITDKSQSDKILGSAVKNLSLASELTM
jgi:basic membrane lipoprotein Med (substrate-binding protein (PBP1-ABC) superfamily)